MVWRICRKAFYPLCARACRIGGWNRDGVFASQSRKTPIFTPVHYILRNAGKGCPMKTPALPRHIWPWLLPLFDIISDCSPKLITNSSRRHDASHTCRFSTLRSGDSVNGRTLPMPESGPRRSSLALNFLLFLLLGLNGANREALNLAMSDSGRDLSYLPLRWWTGARLRSSVH